MDAGADPSLDLGDGAPIEAASGWLEHLLEENDSEGARVGVKMIMMMRENVAKKNFVMGLLQCVLLRMNLCDISEQI